MSWDSSASFTPSLLNRQSFGSRRAHTTPTLTVLFACVLLVAPLALATSVRIVFSQLAGIKTVSVFLDVHGIDGLDKDALTAEVVDHLDKAGIKVSPQNDRTPMLYVRVKRNWLPGACPGILSVQVSLGLSEPVVIVRNPKLRTATGETWQSEGVVALMSAAEACDHVRWEVLSLVDGFASDVGYATDRK